MCRFRSAVDGKRKRAWWSSSPPQATEKLPALLMAVIPAIESSIPLHSFGCKSRAWAAARKISGAGTVIIPSNEDMQNPNYVDFLLNFL